MNIPVISDLGRGLARGLENLINGGAPAELITNVAKVRKQYAEDLMTCTLPAHSYDGQEHIIRISGIDESLDNIPGSIYKYRTFISQRGQIRIICEARQMTNALKEMMLQFKQDLLVRQVDSLGEDDFFRTLNNTACIEKEKEVYSYSHNKFDIFTAVKYFDAKFPTLQEYRI